MFTRRGRAGRLAVLLAAAGACVAPARADSPALSAGAVAGYGDRANVYGAQLVWAPRLDADFLARNDLELRFAAQVARWLARADGTAHGELTDGSVTAELRYWLPRGRGGRAFAEAGLGAHLLSHVQIGKRNLGIAFDFGTQLGAGFTFGDSDRYELAVVFRHVSNGGLQYPNDGFTYGAARFRVALP